VIDQPTRRRYLHRRRRQKGEIEHHCRKHLHADLFGHHELAGRTGRAIYLGQGSGATFPHKAVKDGDSVQFGKCRFDFPDSLSTHSRSLYRMNDLRAFPTEQACYRRQSYFVGE